MVKHTWFTINEVVHNILGFRFTNLDIRFYAHRQVNNTLDHIYARCMLNEKPFHCSACPGTELQNSNALPVCEHLDKHRSILNAEGIGYILGYPCNLSL